MSQYLVQVPTWDKMLGHQYDRAEDMLRETLASFGIGLDIHHFKRHDSVTAYPTRNPHIHKIRLTLRGRLDLSAVLELLKKHLLSYEEFGKWNCEQWEEN